MFFLKMYHFTERIMAVAGKDLKGAKDTVEDCNERDDTPTKTNKRKRLVTHTGAAHTKARKELQAVGKFTINKNLTIL